MTRTSLLSVALLLVTNGCFDPAVPGAYRCEPDKEAACPGGQVCHPHKQQCVPAGSQLDAGLDAARDAGQDQAADLGPDVAQDLQPDVAADQAPPDAATDLAWPDVGQADQSPPDQALPDQALPDQALPDVTVTPDGGAPTVQSLTPGQVVYTRRNGNNPDGEIWLMEANGSSPRLLIKKTKGQTELLQAAVSPDRTKILYGSKPDRAYWVYDVASGARTQIGKIGTSWTWFSAQCGWIDDQTVWLNWPTSTAYASLYRATLGGGPPAPWISPTTLSKNKQVVRTASISPHGKMVVVEAQVGSSTTSDVYLLNIDGKSGVSKIKEDIKWGDSHPVFSPDGASIYWFRAEATIPGAKPYGLHRYDVASKTSALVHQTVTPAGIEGAAWTNDHQALVLGWNTGNATGGHSEIAMLNVASGKLTKLTQTNLYMELAPSVVPAPRLDQGLLAHWKMDEGTGSAVNDSAGSGHGTLTNSQRWTAGVMGPGLSFGGKHYVSTSSAPQFSATGSFSISAWFRTSIGGAEMALAGFTKPSKGAIVLGLDKGKPRLVVHDDVGNGDGVTTTKLYSTGDWHHVVGVRDRAAGKLRIYVNGVVTTATDWTKGAINQGKVTMAIGGRTNSTGVDQKLHGAVDDLRVYNRALTAAEAKALSDSGGWAVTAGKTSGKVTPHALATGPGGAIYVAGLFKDTVIIGASSFVAKGTSPDNDDAFLAKLSATGAFEWARAYGGAGRQYITGLAVDSAGDVALTGRFENSITLDTVGLNGGKAGFVAKVSSKGAVQWAKAIISSQAGGTRVAVDASDNIYLAGFCSTGCMLKTDKIPTGSMDAFVAKLDGKGALQKVAVAGGASTDSALGVAVDRHGDVVFGGYFEGTATFGSQKLASAGDRDVFVAWLGSNLKYKGAVRAGGKYYDDVTGLAMDGGGNVYLTGTTKSPSTFGTTQLSGHGKHDLYVAKLSPSRQFLWAINGGGAGEDNGRGLALDAHGNAYITAVVRGAGWLDATTYTISAPDHTLVAQVSPAGKVGWISLPSSTVTSASLDSGGNAIAVAAPSTVYATGPYKGTVSLGPNKLTAASTGMDGYIWQMPAR